MFAQLYPVFSRVKRLAEIRSFTLNNNIFHKELNPRLQIKKIDEKVLAELNMENKKLLKNDNSHARLFKITPILAKFVTLTIIGKNVNQVVENKKFNDIINEKLNKNNIFSPNKKFIENSVSLLNKKFIK